MASRLPAALLLGSEGSREGQDRLGAQTAGFHGLSRQRQAHEVIERCLDLGGRGQAESSIRLNEGDPMAFQTDTDVTVKEIVEAEAASEPAIRGDGC